MRFFILLFPFSLLSQSLIVESQLDSNYARIGDVISWSITVNKEHNKKIHFPDLEINDPKFSLLSNSIIFDDKKIVGINFELVYWDSGQYVTPDYSIEILKDNGDIDYSLTATPINFNVNSGLLGKDNIDFRPIKGPVPVNSILPIKIIFILILLIFIFYLIQIIWKNKINYRPKKANYLFLDSPQERAIKRIQDLNDVKIPKKFYSEISYISKKFIEEKFYIYTLEMTTEEIKKNRSLFLFDDVYFSKWLSILHQADLVKYASNSISFEKMIQDKNKLEDLIKLI